MNEEIVVTIEIDTYVKNLTEFDERKLVKDSSKVLQMTYESEVGTIRKFILCGYLNEVKRIGRLKKVTLEEKKLMLLTFVRKWKEKAPMEFNRIGWWDLKVALGKGTTSL